MRDVLHIGGLLAMFVFLATRFPTEVADIARPETVRRPFASFAVLSAKDHAVLLERVRTSWQIRNETRGRPSIGRLDAGIALLEDAPPPVADTVFPSAAADDSPVSAPTPETYLLLPQTAAAEMPAFSVREVKRGNDGSRQEAGKGRPAFSREEMLSIDSLTRLKEIMQ